MNITAVMAALDIWDLDARAKQAVLVVACRADRYTAATTVGIRRLAVDMKVNYRTALRALYRAVDAGYLTVDKTAGGISTWRVVVTPTTGVPVTSTPLGCGVGVIGVVTPTTQRKESLDTSKERAARVAARAARGATGDNPPRGVYDHLPNWTAERLNGDSA
ncbi:MAG TPA: hypothetical protein VGH66_07970 [Acidimicrobiales bacterium]